MELNFVHVKNFSNGSGYLLPPGEYWVGDPCHIVDVRMWRMLLTMNFDSHEEMFCGKYDDHYIAALSTAYGDGLFLDNRFKQFSVDSGTIGIVDTFFLKKEMKETGLENIHHFTEPIQFYKNNDDTIFINDEWFIITDQELAIKA